MSDRQVDDRDRNGASAAPQTLISRIDRFCARINDGLAVFAAVLAVVVLVTAVVRVPDLFAQGLTMESGPDTTPAAEWVN